MLNAYTLYCDAAGGKDHGFVVVSGYLSTLERWGNFLHEWNHVLAAFDVPYFHMKEFAPSRGPFVSWKDDSEKRARFLARLANVIAHNVECGFAALVELDTFEKVNQRYELAERFGHPYAFCGMSCVTAAQKYDADLTYIFEDGDEGKGQLMRSMEEAGFNAPVFRYSRDRTDKNGRIVKGHVELQPADFAAYELRKAYVDDPGELWAVDEYRKSFRALAATKSDWMRYTESDLIKTCRQSNIPHR